MQYLLAKSFKLIFVLFILLPFTSIGFSQNESKYKDNLYYKALFASLEKMENEWKDIDDSIKGERVRTDFLNRIVQDNEVIMDDFPTQLGKYRVEYLDVQGLIDRAKKLKKPFSILTGSPIVNEGERLRISFTVQYFRYSKKKIMFSLSDWSDVYFRYDCEKRDFVIDQVKLGGI